MNSNKKIVLLGIFVLAFLVMGVVPVCGLSDSGENSPICGLTDSGSPEASQNFSFYAVYDRLVDIDSFDFTHAAMSGDGYKLIYSGRDKTSHIYAAYTVNADGTGLTQIALPDLEGAGIGELAIDRNGSRAFFKAGGVLCKVENGVATKIFDSDDYPDIASCSQIQTTADGRYVYFLDDRPNDNDVWRVAHSGGSPELIIDDVLVPRDGGVGKQVAKFAISDDGNTIAFTLHGYADPSLFNSYRTKMELFVRDATGGYHQLTNDADEDDVTKFGLAISGDGLTIVFRAYGGPHNNFYAIKSDGSAKIALEGGSASYAGPVLNYDGTKMFYADRMGNCGRLVNTDGSGGIDLFPTPIRISADYDPCISDNGHRISFSKSDIDVYIGYLNDPDAVSDAPVIESIAFDPPAMPRGDPDAVIVLTSEISDPQGLADIKRTGTNELVDGRLYGGTTNVPVYFGHAANDVGWSHDQTAGDGIFSTAGKPGGKIDELDQMTVRMGVKDASGTVVVADTVLFIGEMPPTPAPTPTPTATLFEKIEGLTAIRVGGGSWDNWDADMEKDGPVIYIVYLDARGDTITDDSTKKMPISADVKLYAGDSFLGPYDKLVFSAHYTEDEIILGSIYPDIRIPKEEISVNPSTDYWRGAVEVTIYTPSQGSFADRYDYVRLYEE